MCVCVCVLSASVTPTPRRRVGGGLSGAALLGGIVWPTAPKNRLVARRAYCQTVTADDRIQWTPRARVWLSSATAAVHVGTARTCLYDSFERIVIFYYLFVLEAARPSSHNNIIIIIVKIFIGTDGARKTTYTYR